jgi:hypothetical protein
LYLDNATARKSRSRYAVRLFLRLPVSNPSSAAKIKPCAAQMFRSKSPIQSRTTWFPPAVLMLQTKTPLQAVH